MNDGFAEASKRFLRFEHDLEAQAIFTRQAKESDGLLAYKGVFIDYYEYEINGVDWVWLKYGDVKFAHFYKGHTNMENLTALRKGDELVIIRENELRVLPGNESSQYVVAQISSAQGIVYQSPGFNMPGFIEVPKS